MVSERLCGIPASWLSNVNVTCAPDATVIEDWLNTRLLADTVKATAGGCVGTGVGVGGGTVGVGVGGAVVAVGVAVGGSLVAVGVALGAEVVADAAVAVRLAEASALELAATEALASGEPSPAACPPSSSPPPHAAAIRANATMASSNSFIGNFYVAMA
jgi:hypothetical protein